MFLKITLLMSNIENVTSRNYNLNSHAIVQKSRITDSDLKAAKIRSEEVFKYFIENGKLPIIR